MANINSAKRRARSASDKAARRDSLHRAAARLLRDQSYEQLSLSAIAAQAGIAKASAYTYFSTKESLFLSLLTQRLTAWQASLLSAMPKRRSSARKVATVVAASIEADPVLKCLLARLHSNLEVNVPDADIVAFKSFLASLIQECASAVERALPQLPPGKAAHLFLIIHALVIGLDMASTELPNVSRALAAVPELQAAFDIDFQTELTGVIELVLRGWLEDAG